MIHIHISHINHTGRVNQSLILHPDGEHLIYAVGSAVVIRNKNDAHGFQHILQGHSNSITCLAVSKSGRYIASGQQTHMGYQADIIIWDFETKQLHKRCTLHKVQVLSLAFSPNDKYLASIGGQDDNTVVVWDIVKGVAICGAKASKDTAGPTTCLGYFNNSDDKLVTAGNQVIRVWDVDPVNKKLHVHDCQLGQIKRVVNVVRVSADDQWLYCGTTTGDLLQINLHSYLFTQSGPSKSKDLFSLGITAIHPGKEEILVGCGDGTIASLRTDTLHTQQQCKVDGCVSSLFSDAANGQIVVATDKSNIYHLPHSGATAKLDSPKLVSGCHSVCINKFCFPDNCSDLFATASNDDVRVWNIHNQKELLRLAVPNVSCHSIVFKRDGTSIITGKML